MLGLFALLSIGFPPEAIMEVAFAPVAGALLGGAAEAVEWAQRRCGVRKSVSMTGLLTAVIAGNLLGSQHGSSR